jgi:hypothetical protein
VVLLDDQLERDPDKRIDLLALASFAATSTETFPCPLASWKNRHRQIAPLHRTERLSRGINACNKRLLRTLADQLERHDCPDGHFVVVRNDGAGSGGV